ncbi:MAG: hypothetical protein UY35_C0015G0006 [Candidatus Saccharibacteria bacterium GW2011_GWC2_48_9]|nr:MAG: hypothetical protein UY35_C0015G0006 [Candidatus Saccharibacteria bacterium GW2011_GWC2_48_9]HCH34518.1 hypothetical protein [Candidatus Saccharibacteria bacterium]
MKEKNPQDSTLEALLENHTLVPALEDQQRYLAAQTQRLTAQLTECGTYLRVMDSIAFESVSGMEFGRNAQFELFALATFSPPKAGENARTKPIPISWRNDVGENRPVGRFTDDDLEVLHDFFDKLDADKHAGVLPDLCDNYTLPSQHVARTIGSQATKNTRSS